MKPARPAARQCGTVPAASSENAQRPEQRPLIAAASGCWMPGRNGMLSAHSRPCRHAHP